MGDYEKLIYLLLTLCFYCIAHDTGNLGITEVKKIKRNELLPDDLISTEINSANYKNLITGSNDTWLVFIYESVLKDSWVSYQTWVNFTSYCEKENWMIRFGIIDFTYEKIVPARLYVKEVPSLLWRDRDYLYYVNTKIEFESLKEIYKENTFLQYQRIASILNHPKSNQYTNLKVKFFENISSWFISIFCFSGLLITLIFI